MQEFSRYAIYYAPAPGPFARAAGAWLGRDPDGDAGRAQPRVPGLAEATAEPRRYGFHGTLKAPFRLAEGATPEVLADATRTLAARLEPVVMPGLQLADLHGFLALVPEGDTAALAALAAEVVAGLDHLRAPPTAAETARRRPDRLSPRQRVLLDLWGYPFVMEEFVFHLTLSGPLPDPAGLMPAARAHFAPHLPRPFAVDALCIFAESAATGRFRLHHRVPLSSTASSAARD